MSEGAVPGQGLEEGYSMSCEEDVCPECGNIVDDHYWLTREGIKQQHAEGAIVTMCESAKNIESLDFLVETSPHPAAARYRCWVERAPEDPCSEEFMEEISNADS